MSRFIQEKEAVMNAKIVFIFLVVVLCASTICAVQTDLPGGIAFLSSNNAVVFYPFDGSTPQTLGQAPEKVFAVAKNGDLIAVDQNQFLVTRYNANNLVTGSVSKKTVTYMWADLNSPKCEKIPFVVPGLVKNLSMAPNGNGFSFEFSNKTFGFSLEKDAFCEMGWYPKIGNNVEFTPITTWMRYHELTLPLNELMERYSIARIGVFGAWADFGFSAPSSSASQNLAYSAKSSATKGVTYTTNVKGNFSSKEKLFAGILQYPDGSFRTIEVFDERVNDFQTQKQPKKGDKPGVYEIPVLLWNVLWMAWTPFPDSSLTVLLGDGTLISFNGERIRQGIANSGLVKSTSVYPKCNVPFPVNSLFNIQPDVVAQGIEATKFEWVVENQFIFRHKNGNLCLWENGNIKVLLKSVPETFFYVNLNGQKNDQVVSSSQNQPTH